MAQLVELVRPDRALREPVAEPADVVRRGRAHRQPAAGEGHLRGGREDEGAVGMPRRRTGLQDIDQRRARIGQVMRGIGVVPEQAEVGRAGLHGGQPLDHLGRIGLGRRVGILRHAPHALDRRVGGEALDLVHVGAVPGQRHRDHLDAVGLADREMAVVSRHGAEERGAGLAPRPGAARHALQQREDDRCRASAPGWNYWRSGSAPAARPGCSEKRARASGSPWMLPK